MVRWSAMPCRARRLKTLMNIHASTWRVISRRTHRTWREHILPAWWLTADDSARAPTTTYDTPWVERESVAPRGGQSIYWPVDSLEADMFFIFIQWHNKGRHWYYFLRCEAGSKQNIRSNISEAWRCSLNVEQEHPVIHFVLRSSPTPTRFLHPLPTTSTPHTCHQT